MRDAQIGLSIVVPAFNEERFIGQLLTRVIGAIEKVPYPCEILVVDDGSTDGTAEVARSLNSSLVRIFILEVNRGKGAAVQRGIAEAKYSHVLVQDADLEYEPFEIPVLFECARANTNSVVYGSRVLGARYFVSGWRGRLGLWPGQGIPQRVANSVLSTVFVLRHGRRLSDLLTGYKVYPRSLFDGWSPSTTGFETDHEITVRIVAKGLSIIEVPARYRPRTRNEGKKIKASDFFRACRVLLGRDPSENATADS